MIQTQSPYQVRWGVVGLGGIAQRFLTVRPSLSELSQG